jgi:hypothetical protein
MHILAKLARSAKSTTLCRNLAHVIVSIPRQDHGAHGKTTAPRFDNSSSVSTEATHSTRGFAGDIDSGRMTPQGDRMPYPITAMAVAGLLCALNLTLFLGIIRRRSGSLPRDRGDISEVMLPIGETVPGFSATTLDGDTVALDLITAPTLFGFFSPHCEPCQVESARFAELAGTMPAGRERSLAVVVGEDEAATEFAARLLPTTRVVMEPDAGPLQEAFKVLGVPIMCFMDEHGVVLDMATRADRLDDPGVPSGR